MRSARERLPCCLSKGPLIWEFLDIYQTTFSESVISEIQSLRASSFFSKYLKLHLDLENALKILGKVFCYLHNCIWIGIVKFSLFRTGYFSRGANVLRSSPQIWHVNKRDFSRSIDYAAINEYDKSAVTQIWKVVGNVYDAACQRLLGNVSF